MKEYDFTDVVRPPRIGTTSGIILSVRLLRAAANKPIPVHVLEFLGLVHGQAERVQAAVRGREIRTVGAKLEDQRFDGAWGGVYRRIEAFTRMTGEPEQPKAQAILATLFPNGLSWLLSGHEAEWVHSRRLLDRIEDEGHTQLIVELAGERFLKLVYQTHDELGVALQLDINPEAAEPTLVVGEEVRKLAVAIGDYGRVFAGAAVDDQSLALLEAAMQPLVDHRRRYGRSSSKSDAVEQQQELEQMPELDQEDAGFDVDEPLPPVPNGA